MYGFEAVIINQWKDYSPISMSCISLLIVIIISFPTCLFVCLFVCLFYVGRMQSVVVTSRLGC